MTALVNWFRALSRREKILIGVMWFLIAVVVGYYAIAAPFIRALDQAEEDYVEAVAQSARIESKVAALAAPVASDAKTATGPLDVFVSQQAGEAGFAVGRLEPQSDQRITLVIDSARPTALFGWLVMMEGRGVSAEELNVVPAPNDTVRATIKLRSTGVS